MSSLNFSQPVATSTVHIPSLLIMYVFLPAIVSPTAQINANDSIKNENEKFTKPVSKPIGEYLTYPQKANAGKRMAPTSIVASAPSMQDYGQSSLS